MNHDAIYALYPNVVTVDDTAGAMDKDGKKVAIDKAKVNAWVNPNAYQQKRLVEYPPMADYLDGIVKGDDTQVQKYIDDCLAVKAKYPKGDE
jgi:FMN phosphatase YigB (HAD superfamily)